MLIYEHRSASCQSDVLACYASPPSFSKEGIAFVSANELHNCTISNSIGILSNLRWNCALKRGNPTKKGPSNQRRGFRSVSFIRNHQTGS